MSPEIECGSQVCLFNKFEQAFQNQQNSQMKMIENLLVASKELLVSKIDTVDKKVESYYNKIIKDNDEIFLRLRLLEVNSVSKKEFNDLEQILCSKIEEIKEELSDRLSYKQDSILNDGLQKIIITDEIKRSHKINNFFEGLNWKLLLAFFTVVLVFMIVLIVSNADEFLSVIGVK